MFFEFKDLIECWKEKLKEREKLTQNFTPCEASYTDGGDTMLRSCIEDLEPIVENFIEQGGE